MINYKQLANLNEMKMMARGNPQKLAEYTMKERHLELIKDEHFSEEHPFIDGFLESHLQQLKDFAEANPDDESAQVRYNLQKERFAVREAEKTRHIDTRIMKSEINQKMQEGNITTSDLKKAEYLARTYGSLQDLARYAQIKRQLEGDVE
ncbi:MULTISPECIES: hypothetical protein [Bacillus]|uniref:hypothetical protein n=1 Tax=Bacillus TaxID=1386 RepID=UPI0003032710|nr:MULTISPECIES: hypothetical protein [Bacillus]